MLNEDERGSELVRDSAGEVGEVDTVTMLEDTLVAAVNEAILASQEHAAKRLEGVTGGISIPGLM